MNATTTLAAFAARLRSEVELGALSDQLVDAVQETMHPAHVSLWLRQPASRDSARPIGATGATYDGLSSRWRGSPSL